MCTNLVSDLLACYYYAFARLFATCAGLIPAWHAAERCCDAVRPQEHATLNDLHLVLSIRWTRRVRSFTE